MNTDLSMQGSANQFYYNLRDKGASRMMERQRCILHLIQEYLDRHKYTLSSDAVTSEANLSPNIRVSENIDLEIIFTEYESFYRMKYNKNPLFCRPVEGSEGVTNNKKKGKPVSKPKIQEEQTKQNVQQVTSNGSTNDVNLAMIVTPIFPNENEDRSSITELQYNRELHIHSNLSRCVELYPVDSELRKFAEDISREIVVNNLNVHWNDVIGLETCKTAVKEAIVYPIKYPIFFADKFSSWKGLLLYGPPGTGKTMLAKAIATECNCTFFNITASSLVSKWRGDSEKYIRVLFELAHKYSPTIIFIDEIDWIATKTCPESHVLSEPAKRFRSELLTSLDGLMSPQNSNVVLLATTNAPWNIDEALLRRLEKRIYVELPDMVSKFNIFKLYVSNDILNTLKNSASDHTKLKNCSAADIIQICKQAWMHQSTPMWKRLESKEITLTSDLKYEITDSNSFFDTFDKYQPIIKNVDNYNKWTGVI